MYLYFKEFLKYLLIETLDHKQIGNIHFGEILLNFEKIFAYEDMNWHKSSLNKQYQNFAEQNTIKQKH